jgi:hypothetical protein
MRNYFMNELGPEHLQEPTNRAEALEEYTMPGNKDFVPPFEPTAKTENVKGPSFQDFVTLKAQINDSFAEAADLLLNLQQRFELLDERIALYNSRSSHKL